jgi:DNA helicase II / ATP-dependent DNA helicase PcrA
LDELPEADVEVTESQAGFGSYGGYGASRFDAATSFGSNYTTPGWQRAQGRRNRGGGFEEDDAADYGSDEGAHTNDRATHLANPRPLAGEGREGAGERTRTSRSPTPQRRLPLTIEGELIAKSTGTTSAFALGDRVFHQKFGNGNITAIDGNKLTIQFDKAGQKRVVDSFVERV